MRDARSNDICLVRSNDFQNHEAPPGHPECAERLRAIDRLLDSNTDLAAIPTIAPRKALEPELLRAHAAGMVREVLGSRGKEGWFDADTYFSEQSVDTALLAAGAGMEAALQIWNGKFRRGFVLVRPPGHHATFAHPMGFCLFNNVACAVFAVLAERPQARLAVVDFDLHHGNGTQDLFYGDPNVLFLSSHRYPFYPGTGALEERGQGKGKGTTVNFPLAVPYGDDLFLPLYRELVVPMLREFRPEMIFVSAGFDGHALDPMAGFRLSTEAYGELTELILSAAEELGGKALFCLEGGYHPQALAESVLASLTKLATCPRAPFTPEVRRGQSDSRPLEAFRRFHRASFPNLA